MGLMGLCYLMSSFNMTMSPVQRFKWADPIQSVSHVSYILPFLLYFIILYYWLEVLYFFLILLFGILLERGVLHYFNIFFICLLSTINAIYTCCNLNYTWLVTFYFFYWSMLFEFEIVKILNYSF